MFILGVLVLIALYMYGPLLLALLILTPIYVWFIEPWLTNRRIKRIKRILKERENA